MKGISGLLFAFLAIAFLPGWQKQEHRDVLGKEKIRFTSAIEAFLREDSTSPPPSEGIEFIGSSIFRRWESLKQDMAPLPVFNRAFGGSRTHEVLYYMDKIVVPYRPRIIVYYCGSNDIGGGVAPDTVASRFRQFCERVTAALPHATILFVSVNRAPARVRRWGAIDSANTMVKQYCDQSRARRFVDANSVLCNENGDPKLELFVADRLHLSEGGYRALTSVIKPVLRELWSTRN